MSLQLLFRLHGAFAAHPLANREPAQERPATSLAVPQAQPPRPAGRDLRLDFFRGLALIFIFIDHVPDNFLSSLTLQSVAFSDAAEVFVFVSGYAAALAYGKILNNTGLLAASLRIYRRVWQLYVAHIFILIVFAALVSHVSAIHSQIDAGEFGLAELRNEPDVAFVEAALLQFQPKFLDILPLYIVLLGVFPAVLYLIARHPMLALAPSAAVYILTRLFGWEVHGYPGDHVWFFNPLAWQFLFVAGAAAGYRNGAGNWIPENGWFTGAAIALTVLAAVINISWVVNFYYPEFPGIFWGLLGSSAADKTNLDPLRLISFLVLAVTVAHFVRRESTFLRERAAGWLIACGQNSLHVFCSGILLAAVGHFLLVLLDGSMPMQLAVDVGGCTLMIGLALLLNWCAANGRCA
jgi:hypothetical protein